MFERMISKYEIVLHGNIEKAVRERIKTILPTWQPRVVATWEEPNSNHTWVLFDLVVI